MIEILGTIVGIFRTWLDGRQAVAKAKVETELARESNNAKLLQDAASYNSAWEQAQLLDTDRWLRRVCFIIFFFPLIWAWVDPIAVQTYFNTTLNALPTWYLQTLLAICGAIWGISSLKIPLSNLFSRKK
jgi:hypothetical protein